MQKLFFLALAIFFSPLYVFSQSFGEGSVNYKRWNNKNGWSVASFTSENSDYPDSPSQYGLLNKIETPSNWGDQFGVKVYGYIKAPKTGNYTFYIAGDDNCSLLLSLNSSPINLKQIAYHNGYTTSRQYNKYNTQKSKSVFLNVNSWYYFEAFMKEGFSGDNLSVAWIPAGKNSIEQIPASLLRFTLFDSDPPKNVSNLQAQNIGETSLTLKWAGSRDNQDVKGYKIFMNGNLISSNNHLGTQINVNNLSAGSTYVFTVKAQDPAGNINSGTQITVNTKSPEPGREKFSERTILSKQSMPHDLVLGPDNNLWFIERFSGKVNYVNPEQTAATKTTVLDLGTKMKRAGGQDGLIGLALHPDFQSTKPYVYILYSKASLSETHRLFILERYTYNTINKSLGTPVTILDSLVGSNDHNSGRLSIGPDRKLYMTWGDMGAGQFANQNRPNNAQNLDSPEGKILRLNTELENGSWIPSDNPFEKNGKKTAIYTYGHRNAQGLVWAKLGAKNLLYSSEHGPFSDDEINLIEAGYNYGWPKVIGYCDGNYDGRTTGGYTITDEKANCSSLNVVEPIFGVFAAPVPPNQNTSYLTWPSVGLSGTDFYGSDKIPYWQNSLLVAQLKKGGLSRYKLSSDGTSISSDTINYFVGKGRFRDIAVSADGLKIYVACDSIGQTSGPTGAVVDSPPNPGSILAFSYVQSAARKGLNSFEEVHKEDLVLFPNIAESYFRIIDKSQYKSATYFEIIDDKGQLISTISAENLEGPISTYDMPSGLYFVRSKTKNNQILAIKRLMVKK
jgi:PQQ-dependent dehydrogenase (s-GDH family)